jgi:hypothetical protein
VVMTGSDPAAVTERAVTDILAAFTGGDSRGVVVDSPPGAGKSTLVARAAIQLAEASEPVMVVAQTNEQVDDLLDRMARQAPHIVFGRLSAADYDPTPRVGHTNVRVSNQIGDLTDADVVVATAAKWSHARDVRWRWAIVDEAYQMRADALLRVASRFDRGLFVGDPGQLDPFSVVESERWVGLAGTQCRARSPPCFATIPSCPCTICRCHGGCPRWRHDRSPMRSTRSLGLMPRPQRPSAG